MIIITKGDKIYLSGTIIGKSINKKIGKRIEIEQQNIVLFLMFISVSGGHFKSLFRLEVKSVVEFLFFSPCFLMFASSKNKQKLRIE